MDLTKIRCEGLSQKQLILSRDQWQTLGN